MAFYAWCLENKALLHSFGKLRALVFTHDLPKAADTREEVEAWLRGLPPDADGREEALNGLDDTWNHYVDDILREGLDKP